MIDDQNLKYDNALEKISRRLDAIEKALGIESMQEAQQPTPQQQPSPQQQPQSQPTPQQQPTTYQPPAPYLQPPTTPQPPTYKPPTYQYPGAYRYPGAYQSPPTGYVQHTPNWTEAIVGKYLVGIIASLLVFAAAISLVVLLWDTMSDALRFAIILSAGIAILSVGFIRLIRHKTAITSILIGTGAGLLFIAIAAGNIAFGMLNELTTIGLVLLWSAGLLISFRFSKLFFTSIIAYAGGLIALIFMLYNSKAPMDAYISLVFMLIILGIFLVSTSLWMDKLKQYIAGIMSLVLPISYMTAFEGYRPIRIQSSFINTFTIPESLHFICLLICCATIYGIYFYIKHSACDNISGPKSIALEITALTGYFMLLTTFDADSINGIFGLPNIARMAMVTGVLAVAFVFMYKHVIISLLVLVLTATLTFSEIRGISESFPILGVLTLATLFIKNARFNRKKIVTLCLTCFTFLGIIFIGRYHAYNENIAGNLVYIVGSLCTVATVICLTYEKFRRGESLKLLSTIKIIAFAITTVLISRLISLIIPDIGSRIYNEVFYNTVLYTTMAIISIAVFCSGFFLDWRNPGAFPYRNKAIKRYALDVPGIIAFSCMFLLFYAFLINIGSDNTPWYFRMINTISAIGILALQTYILMGRFRKAPLASVATGILYLVFCWVFLYGWLHMGVGTLQASIVGMALAFGSIYIGYRFRLKALRLFGLVLTIVMTLKAITYDLSDSDGLTRVIALLIGGIICFAISVVYTKLESALKQAQQAQQAQQPQQNQQPR